MKDGAKVKDNVKIVLRGPDGKIKEVRELHNTVAAVGDAHIADQLSEVPDESPMSHMAIGTGDNSGLGTAVTALATELDRNALTSFNQGAGADDNDVIYIADWAAGDGTGAITEAGIFNDPSAGTILLYSTFAVINKAAGDTLQITWTLSAGSS